MGEETSDLRTKLERLVIDDRDFAELQRQLGDFCPFEALGVVRNEIRHSNFLATMLDPNKSHGLGTSFLRRFLDGVVRKVGERTSLGRLRLHVADLEDADVRREWRNIDLLIALDSVRTVFAFELKIDAGEGMDQLDRYQQTVRAEWRDDSSASWRHVFLFLTRDEAKASRPEWIAMDYGVVVEAIDRTLATTTAGALGARAMLSSYAAMLRRKIMGDPTLEELARTLWKRHGDALKFLVENAPDELFGLADEFSGKGEYYAEKFSTERIKLIHDHSTKTYLRFAVSGWEALGDKFKNSTWTESGRFILIQLTMRRQGIIAQLILGPSQPEYKDTREVLYDMLNSASTRNRGYTPDWSTFATAKLFDAAKLPEGANTNDIIKNVAEEMKTFLDQKVAPFDEAIRKYAEE